MKAPRMPFAFRMAAREWRLILRRLGVYMLSITVGVAVLVALHSFRDDVVRSIEAENRSLLGGDARIGTNRPLPDSVTAIVDSLVAEGAEAARVTQLLSMALASPSGLTRLVQLRGVEPGFPHYGSVTTDPPGLWGTLAGRAVTLVDKALMAQLDIAPGDTLRVGTTAFLVAGSVDGLPTDIGLQAAAGPRVFVDYDQLGPTGLLTLGSLARYNVYLRLPDEVDPDEVEGANREVLRATGVSFRTPAEQARSLTDSADFLADFLGLVGLGALLLGGIGVGSAVNVYIRGRLTSIAVLRCVGATRRQVFLTYLLQATLMGLMGSLVGVALGLVVQRYLPLLIRNLLPVSVTPGLSPASIGFGLALGTWVALVFALLPLLQARRVSPLQALRHVAERPNKRDPARLAALLGLATTVLALALFEAPEPELGLAFAIALTVVAGVLSAVAWALAKATHRFFPRRAGYTLRQGVANLFRPGNQTVSITLALGFGILVVGVIVQLQRNLSRELSLEVNAEGSNMLLFDVQPDQETPVTDLLADYAEKDPELSPIVTMRVASVNGRATADILADSLAPDRPERWTLRREYRSTFRHNMKPTESITAGQWWNESDLGESTSSGDSGLPGVSLDEELADDLRVDVGDTITWSVGGLEVTTQVKSLRNVDWSGFATNFFAVFEPGVLESFPRTSVVLANVPGDTERMRFQTALVRGFPNVSVMDLGMIRATVEAILARVVAVIRILAGLSTVAGLVVMTGSMASSRTARMREGALLRTLGARVRQIRQILMSEYVALGTMASAVGGVLALIASWLVTTRVFEVEFVPAVGPALLLWLGVVALTVLTGLITGKGLARTAPLSVLREAAD